MPSYTPKVRTISNYSGNWGFGGYPEKASFTTSQGSNKDLTFTSSSADASGNSTTIRYVNPGTASAALSVSVTGSAVTVNLGTDGSSVPNSTASAIRTAVNGNTQASALLTASLASGSTGAGAPSALAATALTGGRSQTVMKGPTRPTVIPRRSASSITRRF